MMIFYPGSEGATVVSFHIISVVYVTTAKNGARIMVDKRSL